VHAAVEVVPPELLAPPEPPFADEPPEPLAPPALPAAPPDDVFPPDAPPADETDPPEALLPPDPAVDFVPPEDELEPPEAFPALPPLEPAFSAKRGLSAQPTTERVTKSVVDTARYRMKTPGAERDV
jgi:hypothetical protein